MGLAAPALDLGDHRGRRTRLARIVDQHVRAGLRERQRDAAPDAARGASDERQLAGQDRFSCHRLFLKEGCGRQSRMVRTMATTLPLTSSSMPGGSGCAAISTELLRSSMEKWDSGLRTGVPVTMLSSTGTRIVGI